MRVASRAPPVRGLQAARAEPSTPPGAKARGSGGAGGVARRSPGGSKLPRRRIRWSKEETEKLRELQAENGTSWAAILEAGRDVFDPVRTAVDLKDKWRNMNKG